MLVWILFSVGAVGVLVLGYYIAQCQHNQICKCLDLKTMHDDLLCGKINISDMSDSHLLSLRRSMFTVVGVGGVGPYYSPTFFVVEAVDKELARKRANRKGDKK